MPGLETLKGFFDTLKEHNNDGTHKGAYVALVSEKGAPLGVATLDGSSFIPLSQIPVTLTGKDADTLDGYHAAGLAKAGANSDITSLSGLTTPLSNVQGGSGNTIGASRLYGYQHTAVSLTGTANETTLFSMTIPANAMGLNGILRIGNVVSTSGAGGTKTFRLKFGGVTFTSKVLSGTNAAGASGTVGTYIIGNRNAANSQLGAATAGSLYSGAVTAAVDTTVDQTLVVTGQLSSASDTMTLELTDVEVLKP